MFSERETSLLSKECHRKKLYAVLVRGYNYRVIEKKDDIKMLNDRWKK